MSGPKIVDIRVLQAQRERELRLLRERIAYQRKQWEGSRQRLPPLPGKLTPLHLDHFFHQGA